MKVSQLNAEQLKILTEIAEEEACESRDERLLSLLKLPNEIVPDEALCRMRRILRTRAPVLCQG